MKSVFGKSIRLEKEGVFLISLPLISIAYSLISPAKPSEVVIASLVLFLVFPFLVVRFLLRENVHFLGFKKGKMIRGLTGTILGWALAFPLLNLLASQESIQKLYPPLLPMRESVSSLIFLEFAVMLPAFFGVQTFLYGYTLQGLRKIIGKKKAIFLLSFLCVPLFYLGRPFVEIIIATFVAVVTCWIKYRGESVLYPIVFGWGISFILDALVVYKILSL